MITSPSDPSREHRFQVGEWTVEPGHNRIVRRDETVHLEPKIMAVLVYLAKHRDRVVSSDELIREVWDDRPMGDSPVYRCITQLRKALGDKRRNPAYVLTVPKSGYRLIAPVASESVKETPDIPPAPDTPRRPFGLIALGAVVLGAVITLVAFVVPSESDGGAGAGPAIAVLPFAEDPETGEPATGSGLAGEVSRQLSAATSLTVISQNSTASLGPEVGDIPEAAGLLKVDHLLTGRLQAGDGEEVLVEGRLFDAAGRELWNYRVGARPDEVLGLADEIARGVSQKLDAAFHPGWVSACGGTRDLAACQKYKLAREHLRDRRREHRMRALRLFEEAIETDPEFAAAFAGMGYAYLLPGGALPWPEAVENADVAIRRALELDPQLAEAHVARAVLRMTDRNGPCPPLCRDLHGYDAAERDARHAVLLDPTSPTAQNILAIALYGQGRLREAARHFNTALVHDPLNPSIIYNTALFKAFEGDYPGAIEYVRDILDRHPNEPASLHKAIALIEHFFGHYDRSLEALHALVDDPSDPLSDWLWTENYFHLGLPERVEEIVNASRDEAYFEILEATTRKKLLVRQGRLAELESLVREMEATAGARYDTIEAWPRWMQRMLGQSLFLLGRHDEAVAYLARAHGADGSHVSQPFLVADLDSLQALAYSHMALGDTRRGERLLERSLELIRSRRSQGYGNLPELTAAEARAYAIQDRKALAVATMRKAVAEGWRGHHTISPDDPRWDSVFAEPDFEALLGRVRQAVDRMRDRMENRVAQNTPPASAIH